MPPIAYAIIASGSNVSSEFDFRQYRLDAIFVPAVNSGDLAVQANYDTTSANFLRMFDVRGQAGSGDLRFPVVTGSRMIPFAGFQTPAYARFEMVMPTNSFQTDNRTLTLITRPRR